VIAEATCVAVIETWPVGVAAGNASAAERVRAEINQFLVMTAPLYCAS
jgi:hypothetical protein